MQTAMGWWSHLTARVHALEPVVSWLAFLGGVLWDVLTLDRIDRWANQLTLAVLWGVVLGSLLLVASVSGEGRGAQRLRWLAALGAQFALGGLLSALSIFFLRSTSWSVSILFVLAIVLLLVANEFFRAHYQRATALFGMWCIATSALALLIVPTVWGEVSERVAVAALALAAAVQLAVGWLLARIQGASGWGFGAFALGVPLVLFGLYWANLIPPAPLVAKEVGVYHHLWRDEAGYHLVRYSGGWFDWIRGTEGDKEVSVADAPIFCFSAIFAPQGVEATIYHHWQQQTDAQWRTHSRIAIPLVGGREAGYRGYSFIQNITPGLWRCRVEDERGRVLGEAQVRVREERIDAREEVVLR